MNNKTSAYYFGDDGGMTSARCLEILRAAKSGAGGYVLRTERKELLDIGYMVESELGLVLTEAGKTRLARG